MADAKAENKTWPDQFESTWPDSQEEDMFKKITLLAAALAAFVAFAVPAVAQAEVVTNAGGEEAEGIEMESSNTELTTATGAVIKCSTKRLGLDRVITGRYTTPFTEVFGEHGHGTNHLNPECVSFPSGVTIRVTSIHAAAIVQNNGNSRFVLRQLFQITHPVFGPLSCFLETKEGTESEESSYTPTTDEASIVGELTGGGAGGAACPASGEIHGDFTITDENGEPTSIH